MTIPGLVWRGQAAYMGVSSFGRCLEGWDGSGFGDLVRLRRLVCFGFLCRFALYESLQEFGYGA